MYKHLVRYSAKSCAGIGSRVLSRLQADPRLAEAAAILESGQGALTAKVAAFESATETALTAQAERDMAYRNMEDRLREFALNLLAVVRNDHEHLTYRRYFPAGYGSAIHQTPGQILDVARVVLGKLGEEEDPWLRSFRERIRETAGALEAAHESCVAAIAARRAAFAYMAAEKRSWICALAVSRLRAEEICLSEAAYLRLLFEPAETSRRGHTPSPADEGATWDNGGSFDGAEAFETAVALDDRAASHDAAASARVAIDDLNVRRPRRVSRTDSPAPGFPWGRASLSQPAWRCTTTPDTARGTAGP